eukprot:5601847-Pyramimonas_sp.AAC.1
MGHPNYVRRLSPPDRAVPGIFLRVPEDRNRSIGPRHPKKTMGAARVFTARVINKRAQRIY